MIYHVPYIVRKALPQMVWRYTAENSIYLTFDDGPIPEVTPYVLDTLAAYGAKATFFCVGDNVRKYPKLYQRILQEGHSVGNHTYHHKNGWKTQTEQYMADVDKAAKVIDSRYFRPPYGKLRPAQLKKLREEYTVVMWDVLSGDYDPSRTADQCLQTVTAHSTPGSVVVFHDSLKAADTLREILPKVLHHCKENGWDMAAIEQADHQF